MAKRPPILLVTREHKDANLVISRRPSCFGSDEERASGEKDAEDEEAGWKLAGWLVLRSAAYGSPDVLEKKKNASFILFSGTK